MTKFDPHRYMITVKRVFEDGEPMFKATVKELPHVAEYGNSYNKVYELAIDTIEGLREMAGDMGHPFPDPVEEDDDFSGRVTLRLPKSLHRSTVYMADIEGVSLNQFLVATIAEKVSSGNFYTALVRDLDNRLVSSRVTTLLRDIASIGYSASELIIGDVKKYSLQERAATTEPSPFQIPFDESKLLVFKRS